MNNELKEYYIGLDIGGTKCAIVIGDKDFKVHRKVNFQKKI